MDSLVKIIYALIKVPLLLAFFQEGGCMGMSRSESHTPWLLCSNIYVAITIASYLGLFLSMKTFFRHLQIALAIPALYDEENQQTIPQGPSLEMIII